MSRLEVRIALVLAVTAPLVAASMGGWATVSVDNLPESLVAGRPINMTFSVRQHGEELLKGLNPTITGVSGRNELKARAVETNKPGYYTVTLNPAQTGEWTFTVHSGYGTGQHESRLTLLPIAATGSNARPVAMTHEQRGQRLFVAKGCVSCHLQRGIQPIETHVARIDLSERRLSPGYLEQFLADPSVKKAWPNNWKMPDLQLKPAEISALVAFLNAGKSAGEISWRE